MLAPHLRDRTTRDALVARTRQLTPDAERHWGTLTPRDMIWHLTQSFVGVRDQSLPDASTWFMRVLIRRVALHTHMRWPPGAKTLRAVDPAVVKPEHAAGFATDVEGLVGAIEAFSQWDGAGKRHPVFGELTNEEWQHWGWRHVDHHLRQFGC